jgi:hypothetical protein
LPRELGPPGGECTTTTVCQLMLPKEGQVYAFGTLTMNSSGNTGTPRQTVVRKST